MLPYTRRRKPNPRLHQELPPPPPSDRNKNPIDRPPTISVNITQIGEREANDDFDPDEVESVNPQPALVNVVRYMVREEIAPLLHIIILKYGDIGADSILKSHDSLVFHLERICWAYNQLQEKHYKNFPKADRMKILNVVNDAAAVNIKVDWLQERLHEIENAFRYSREYFALKEQHAANSAVMARMEAELKKKIQEQDIIDQELLVRKAKINQTFGKSFVKNLLDLV